VSITERNASRLLAGDHQLTLHAGLIKLADV
jgi:hypothetical protein